MQLIRICCKALCRLLTI